MFVITSKRADGTCRILYDYVVGAGGRFTPDFEEVPKEFLFNTRNDALRYLGGRVPFQWGIREVTLKFKGD